MMWDYGYHNAGMGWFGVFCLVIFVVIVAFLAIGGMRMARRGYWMHGEHYGNSNALDIAKERYAKGEINHDEFEKIKKNLS